MNRAIGEQINAIVDGVIFCEAGEFAGRSNSALLLLGLVTVMQYVEYLPDALAAEATGQRMDWKYALHLPVHFPGLEPGVLSEFRGQLITSRSGMQAFQLLLDNLAQAGLLGCPGQQRVLAKDVLNEVHSLNHITCLMDAMGRAIEALAANQPEWLRANSQAHWFMRYRSEVKNHPIPRQEKPRAALANEVGADIQHLIGAVEKDAPPEIAGLPEIRELRKLAGATLGEKNS